MEPVVVFVPLDAAARSVGADDVATAIVRAAAVRQHQVRLVRNGSRGMFWLEPLVEVSTPKGRVAYGPVEAESVGELLDAGMLEGAPAPALPGADRGDLPPEAADTFHVRESRGQRSPLGG